MGIGASAGGIQALKELFLGLPADTGMAYAIVLHLSKDYDSNLDLILQNVTAMPVSQVTEAEKVEPNHVYVIPPGKQLELVDGIIRLRELEKLQGRHITIDHFFRSLAMAYGRRAVCIILSGSGSDGTMGLRHIKGQNGFAIVQAPEEAQFDSMPNSAIATGLVDLVLPVSQMVEKLQNIRQTTEEFYLVKEDQALVEDKLNDTDSLRELLTFLKLRTGNDFSNYKRPTLLRRIARHLQIHEVPDIPAYMKILRERPDETPFLIKNLLINVTNFFRDKEAFEQLEKEVIPKLFEGKTWEDQVRVWVAGCSSGEEAYSLAILLTEHAATLAEPPKIQIFASDVDVEVIAQAKEAFYLPGIVEDVSPERLQLYFTKEKTGYRVKKNIRELVLFATHNLLSDPPFSKLDLVSCRNVIIYLNRDTQEKLMNIFHFALKPEGFMFLGSSESADSLTNLFKQFDKKNRIYQRRIDGKPSTPLQVPIEGTWQVKMPEIVQPLVPKTISVSYNLLHHRLLNPYMPPSVLLNENYDILHLSENVGRYLHFYGGDVSANLLKVVLPALRGDLRATLFTAKQNEKKETSRPISVEIDGETSFIYLIADPIMGQEIHKGMMLVLFQEQKEINAPVEAKKSDNGAIDQVIQQLEEELQHTKEQLQKTIEQYETSVEELKASNEEQQAINEELRSASEELETGKEEIQSVNEELTTINHEMKEKMEEIGRINSDLQNLMASTNIGTIFLDRQLRIKRYTPHMISFFNIIATDVNRPLYHLKHHFNYDNFREDAEKVLRTLQPIEREIESQDKQVYILRYFPYRTHDDKIDGVVLTFVDISERRRSEVMSVWLSTVVEATADAIINFSPEGEILTWNQGAENIFGYKPEEVIGKHIKVLAPPDQPQQEQFFEALQLGKLDHQKRFETTNIRKDGEIIHTCLTALIIKKGVNQGEMMGATVMVEDVTESKKTAALIRRNTEEIETLMNVTPIAIFVTHDTECKVITGNPAGIQLLQLPVRKGINLSKSAPPEERPSYKVFREGVELKPEELPMQISAKEGIVVREEALELRFEDGSHKYIFAYVNPLFDENAKPRGAVAAMMDITERKRIEVELREKNKELEQFAYVASHDLQEPLSTINSFIDLILEEGTVGESTKEYMEYIKSSSNRLTDLIHDLLNHSRIGSSGNKEMVDCNKMVALLIKDMAKLIESKKAKISVGELPTLNAYPNEMRLLFQNLMSNAIKFQHKDIAPAITISAELEDNYWHFVVADNGIGIEEKYQEKIFVIFQRLHVEEDYPGTGIGLAHCKKIVELHEGKIWVESELGKGTEFHFTIDRFL